MSRKDDEMIINIGHLINILKNNVVSIITWSMLGLVVSMGIVFLFIEPRYSSNVDILVNQKANNEQVQYTTQQADLQAINTYKDVLTKPIILAPVLKEVKRTDRCIRKIYKSIKSN